MERGKGNEGKDGPSVMLSVLEHTYRSRFAWVASMRGEEKKKKRILVLEGKKEKIKELHHSFLFLRPPALRERREKK